MKKTEGATSSKAVLLNRKEYYERLGCGRVTADQIAREAGAERRFGRRVLIFYPDILRYLESSGQGAELQQ